jgi:hypothetical protein
MGGVCGIVWLEAISPMFKVIREFVPAPMFLMMCDNRSCAASATMPANFANAEELRLSQDSFLKQAVKDGWVIGLDAQLCPGHAELARVQAAEARERGRQRVEPANGMDTARFGKPGLVKLT